MMQPSAFEAARRGISDKYVNDSATNKFGRFVSQQRGNRQIGDFQRGFQRQMPGFTANWGRRGMTGAGVQSGVFRGAMQRYVGDYTRQLGGMRQDLASDLQGFDLQQAQLDAAKQRALADLQMQQQIQMANTAQNLVALRPYIGG
jgi:hypothetical protein